MKNPVDYNEIHTEINSALDRAENTWKQVKDELSKSQEVKMMSEGVNINSDIPGHESFNPDIPEVGNFIALVLDLRDSTKHLTQAIKAKASELERVLYETTALNTLGGLIISRYNNASITEFLGDGYLALFEVKQESDKTPVHNAHNASKKIIEGINKVVNPILKKRYELPPLNVGIGLAYSKAIVTTVGYKSQAHPKAIGKCVYRASKLSNGKNVIRIDECLRYLWPKEEGGILSFRKVYQQEFNGYEITKNKG